VTTVTVERWRKVRGSSSDFSIFWFGNTILLVWKVRILWYHNTFKTWDCQSDFTFSTGFMEIDESLRILQNSTPVKSLELWFQLSRKPGNRGVKVFRFLGPNFDTSPKTFILTQPKKRSFKLHSILNAHEVWLLLDRCWYVCISPNWVVWVCPSTSERHRIAVGIQHVVATFSLSLELHACSMCNDVETYPNAHFPTLFSLDWKDIQQRPAGLPYRLWNGRKRKRRHRWGKCTTVLSDSRG